MSNTISCSYSYTIAFMASLLVIVLGIWSAHEQEAIINGRDFSIDLEILADRILCIQKFQNHVDRQHYRESPIDGLHVMKKLADTLELKFQRITVAVKALRDKIEKAYREPAASDDFPHCCSTEVGDMSDRRFKTKVNTEKPCVFRQDRSVDTGIVRDDILQVMKDNLRDIPSLKWQYYGSHDGHMTIYPGIQKCDQVFDPRYRPWYVVAAAPKPKDVVIVIDTSGSMTDRMDGDKPLIDTASEAAETIISYLNANDRVAVVSFSSTAKTYSDLAVGETCYKNELAVATHHNKETLKKYLKHLKPEGNTEYGLALEKAFDFFAHSEDLETDNIKRDKVILFFTGGHPTDAGGADSILKTVKKRNAELNNTVVILTYGFGEILRNTTSAVLRDMAHQTKCNLTAGEATEGEFRLIAHPQDLKREMGSFYNFFSNTGESPSVVFTVPYNDSLNLGLIMSACLPVHCKRELKGVTCIDMAISDIVSDVTYFRHGELSYAFLVDGKGRLLMHPLMPNPYFVNDDPIFLKATTLETAKEFKQIMKSMMRGDSGNETLNSVRVSSRGDVDKEGVSTTEVRSHFIWRPIHGTNFSVCIVIAVEDKDKSLTWGKPYPKDFLYHTQVESYQNCKHHGRTVVEDKTSVKFTPDAFLDPFAYIVGVDNPTTAKLYEDIMTGIQDENSPFRASVRNTVAVSAILEKLWQEPRFVIWSYFGSTDGVFRKMPAARSDYNYDHKLRLWYQRIIGHQDGLYTLTIPYKDPSCEGLLVTFGRVIYEGKASGMHKPGDPIIGVLAMDFNLRFVYSKLLARLPQCEVKPNECFILDSSGFIIIHRSFFQSGFDASMAENVHITIKETFIAEDLLKENVMRRKVCANFGEFRNQYSFEVSFKANQGGKLVKPNYEIHDVPGSNIFIVMKKTATILEGSCSCHYQQSMSISRECSNKSCECPCYNDMDYDHCRENFTRSLDDPAPCTPSLKPVDFDANEIPPDTMASCHEYECTEFTTKETCGKQLFCRWCSIDTFGNQLPTPFCTEQLLNCKTKIPEASTKKPTLEQSSSSSTKKPTLGQSSSLNNGAIAGISIAVVLLILLIIIIFYLVLKRNVLFDPCKTNATREEDDPPEPANAALDEDPPSESTHQSQTPKCPGVPSTPHQPKKNEKYSEVETKVFRLATEKNGKGTGTNSEETKVSRIATDENVLDKL